MFFFSSSPFSFFLFYIVIIALSVQFEQEEKRMTQSSSDQLPVVNMTNDDIELLKRLEEENR